MNRRIAINAPQDADSDINLTPMLDVVFIMLIFFIVTASFIKEAGIPVSRPDATTVKRPSDESIMIRIGENSGIWFGNRLVDPRAARSNIERMHSENPAAPVVIVPDRRSINDALVQVMDASRAAGVYGVSIGVTDNK